MNLAPHLRSGRDAEDSALAYLQERGLKLLTRNYRCPQGELDLVLLDAATLVIAEVRYRRNAGFGSPAETVGQAKQQKIIHATQHFLQQDARLRRKPVRFDVVAVRDEGGGAAVEWIRDAFRADS